MTHARESGYFMILEQTFINPTKIFINLLMIICFAAIRMISILGKSVCVWGPLDEILI